MVEKREDDAILRLNDVCKITGLSRSTIFNKLNTNSKYYDPDFPKQHKISGNIIGWSSLQIQDWIAKKVNQSNTAK